MKLQGKNLVWFCGKWAGNNDSGWVKVGGNACLSECLAVYSKKLTSRISNQDVHFGAPMPMAKTPVIKATKIRNFAP